jgi:hypothetical protein
MSRKKNGFRPSFETLETREMMAGLTGGLSGGVLTINGTSGNDTIPVHQSGGFVSVPVSVDGEIKTARWNVNKINKIQINAGRGDDNVILDMSPQLAAKLYVTGGSGSDAIHTRAKPAHWSDFEKGRLIPPPQSSTIPVIYSGTGGPYYVTQFRGEGKHGELVGEFPTRDAAERKVAAIQKWASTIKDPLWQVVKITVEGTSTPLPATRELATKILNNSKITLATAHSSEISDNAFARLNILDAANGRQAARSPYGDMPGKVSLSPTLLNGMLKIAQKFEYKVSEIAGGDHGKGSLHYYGRAVDINFVGNKHVKELNLNEVLDFAKFAESLGAKVYGPHNKLADHWNHFHLEW